MCLIVKSVRRCEEFLAECSSPKGLRATLCSLEWPVILALIPVEMVPSALRCRVGAVVL